MLLKLFVIVIVLMSSVIGCARDASSSMDATEPLQSVIVVPADGQTNVRLDAVVTIAFAKPVDRTVAERNIHLISERMLADSLCPDSLMMSHGGMGSVMMDSSMMRHMGQVHATQGRFVWDVGNTSCTFAPDSMMSPQTQYMVHMGPEMMQMLRNRMGEMDPMGGHGSGMMQDDMMLHFTTLDTAGTGSGHGGHH